MQSMTWRSMVVLTLLALISASCGTAATTTTQAVTTSASLGDVLEVAASEGDLNTFLAALDAAGIMADFHGQGPFTLFVPTDAAFNTYLTQAGMTQTELFGDQDSLRTVLNYHIVNMTESAEQVMAMAGQSFSTAAGLDLQVAVEGDTVMVGAATVERYDIQASDGIIHVIDSVLVPPEG